jgi:hypothetical protein
MLGTHKPCMPTPISSSVEFDVFIRDRSCFDHRAAEYAASHFTLGQKMRSLIAVLIIIPLVTLAEVNNQKEPEFALTTEYFDTFVKSLDYYPFTDDLKTIDEAIAGEYSYNWSIGVPRVRHIVEAACLGDFDRVLLGWWRSTDREARVAVLAIYYNNGRDPEMTPFPNFARDAERFGPEEAEERIEEIKFVRSNLHYFKKWLRSLASDDLPEDAKFRKIIGPK